MKQDYVICKGKRYNTGDVMHIAWYTNGYQNKHNYTGIFIDCDEEKDEYRFTVDGQMYCFNRICFWRTVLNEPIREYYTKREPRKATFTDELSIDGLFLAWVWYIFIMAVAIIFKDCIGIWLLASAVFFSYRNRKLREAGYKK